MELSDEQLAVVNAPLVPLAVIACAGSGKTATAIHRVAQMRRQLGASRGRIALLSFSNVAVETFRSGYRIIAQTLPSNVGADRVDIDTLDGFFTTHVLRPHAHRTMGCDKAAFLVTGGEAFLAGYTCPTGNFPIPITDVKVTMADGQPRFYYSVRGNPAALEAATTVRTVHRLGQVGAYTHDLGRYWSYRVLREQPHLLQVLARRYPHIIIDESQDIGSFHQLLLDLLIEAGVQVSLIGDPNQGIYEFAGANGSYLRSYHERNGVLSFALTCNYRSVQSILYLANQLAGRDDQPTRQGIADRTGAYYITYANEGDLPHLMDAFQAEVGRVGIDRSNAAVLCRARPLVEQLAGSIQPSGRGVTKAFAEAAIYRDMRGDYLNAFKAVSRAFIGLMAQPPHGLLAQLTHHQDQQFRQLRQKLWIFTRDAAHGLPSCDLPASGIWHTQLFARVREMLGEIQQEFEFQPQDRLGNRLARTLLPEGPLNLGRDLVAENDRDVRIETVHQVKGESIDAVLYVATAAHARAMLEGVGSEVGRIGYVAATRARSLFWLALPREALGAMRAPLNNAGFLEVGR